MQTPDREARHAKAAEEVSKLMLSGWSMTAQTCPVEGCYNPLYSKPGDRNVLRCPHCGVTLKKVEEGRFVVTALDEDSPVRQRTPAQDAAPVEPETTVPVVSEPELAPEPATSAAASEASAELQSSTSTPAPSPDAVVEAGAEDEEAKRHARSSTASRMMGQRMLSGFAMLDEYCCSCGTPLMRSRAGVKECVLITAGLCNGQQPGAAPTSAATTAGPGSALAASAAASGAGADDLAAAGVGDFGAGISAEEAASAFAEVVDGAEADMAGGPEARQLESFPAGLGGVPRVDTDELMRRAMGGGAVLGESKEGDAHEDDDEEGEEGDAAGAIEALREARPSCPTDAKCEAGVIASASAAVLLRISKATKRLQEAVSDVETAAALALLRDAADTLRTLRSL